MRMRLGRISRLAMVGLAALALLASIAPVASAKIGGFHDGFFSRNRIDDLGAGPPSGTTRLIDVASASGATIARFNVLWCRHEPDFNGDHRAGVWTSTIADVNKIIDSGMRPLPILINAPVWARASIDRPAGGTGCDKKHEDDAAYPPEGDSDSLAAWDEFVGRFIRCMRGIGNAGGGCPMGVEPPVANLELNTPPIQGYEIWNEPNLGKYWGKGQSGSSLWKGDADRFLRLLRGAFAVPHSRPVVLGGLSFPNDGDWGNRNVAATRYLERIYNVLEIPPAEPPKFDVIGVHPYDSGMHTSATFANNRVLDTYQVRNRHNDDTSVWVTEVGDDAHRLASMWDEIQAPVIIFYRLMDSCPETPPDPQIPGSGCNDIDTGRDMGVFPWRQFSNPRNAYCQLAARWGAFPSDCG
jgi:hypothetical protein